ncbi:hypothetical protein MAR_022183 [Mya arenaria]|uniref:DDE Tnp4 domain-containing protein n=1 Tax=Mya arenaria TaxID=6604 RepID=A0ABY7DN77_MYAAR|nr:hypothetical protein MAR_022183 [Mya arenaria]
MAAPRRLRMALLEHELAQARFQYNLVLAAILEAAERERQRARRRERRWWVRAWILRRPLFGQYETLMKELEAEHAADFKAFLRMEPQMYYELLNRPYPHRHLARDERIFNYRCSRARRVVENAFGILANRFRCLLTTLGMRPSTVTKTVMACMTLHNRMRTRYPNIQNANSAIFCIWSWVISSIGTPTARRDADADEDLDLDLDLDEDVGLDCDDFDAWDARDAMESASDISDCSPSVPLAPPSSSCILFRGDFLVFTASVFCFFWPFPLLLAGCCLFLLQFFSSPSLSLTNFGILFIKSVKSESCGYNLLNAVHRQERTVYILAEISGRVTAEFRPSIGRCPLHRSATGTILSKALSHIGRSSVGARPMHGTPADNRPCTGRRVFRCGYDGAAMRELGESPVKFSSEVKISPSCHRCGFKQQTPRMSGRCPAGVR